MPRTADPEHVQRWAELWAKEKTIAQIRKDHLERTRKTVDPRTIQRALERTQAEFAERAATTAELRRGIRVHGEQLLKSLEPLTKAVRSTIRGQLNPLPIYAIDTNQVAVGSSIAKRKGGSWSVQIAGEDAIELRLLMEHLPNDRAWQKLAEFSGSAAKSITARIEFASEIKREFDEVLKSLTCSGTTTAEPFEQAGLSVIDVAVSAARIDGRLGIDKLLDSLNFDSRSGDLRIGSTKLLSIEEGGIEKYRTVISNGVQVVLKSGIGQDVLTTRTAFDRAASNLLDELTTLGLVTYLPRTCRSCRRFRL